MDPLLVRELQTIVGAPHVLLDADGRAGYEVDWTGRFRGRTPAVIRPGTVDEVAAVVEVCRAHQLAIVPQGGNTGLVGGSVPLAGEVVVSLRRLDHVGEVDVTAQQLSVGAGATIEAVQLAAGAAGLRYAVDFGARGTATVGGSIATNAGGNNLIRYGGTREQVVGIEAVLGTGERVRRMSGLIKDNTGFHLPSLLCGSEGALGIITAARLRLVGAAPHRVTALVAMTAVDAAVAAVASWRAQFSALEVAELMLADGLELVCSAFGLRLPMGAPAPAYVLVELAGETDPTDALGRAIAEVAGVVDVAVATDSAQRAALWRLRDDHPLAINRVGTPHKFDVTLPQQSLGEFIGRVREAVAGVTPDAGVWVFGHVGDGNLHVNVTGVDPSDLEVDEAVYRLVVAMEGSISAEHGIGTAKRRFLPLDRSSSELSVMRSIKRALDPESIMNPQVLFET